MRSPGRPRSCSRLIKGTFDQERRQNSWLITAYIPGIVGSAFSKMDHRGILIEQLPHGEGCHSILNQDHPANQAEILKIA